MASEVSRRCLSSPGAPPPAVERLAGDPGCGPAAAAAVPCPPEEPRAEVASPPDALLSARIVVISDFNCPYCFTLNEWISGLGLADQVRWVGIEHKPHLPLSFASANRQADRTTLENEVSDVQRRAPDLGVRQPPVWVNSRQALLLQAAIEDEAPQRAAALRQRIFRDIWLHGRNIADPATLDAALAELELEPLEAQYLAAPQLDGLTTWWRQELDRIPCMLAPTGARHLGLQDRRAVEAFLVGALQEPPPAPGCR
ncbi:MAG: hypothetical protein VKK62_01765 [Synechococcaceae cyanobacterium]|nr:hypothetical protein [Synechococcaceae cyanobacterium]